MTNLIQTKTYSTVMLLWSKDDHNCIHKRCLDYKSTCMSSFSCKKFNATELSAIKKSGVRVMQVEVDIK